MNTVLNILLNITAKNIPNKPLHILNIELV